jgi:hypothetical protein
MTLRLLSELELWPQNYHEGHVGAIIASIEQFGFNGALRTHGNTVVAGNHALKALRILRERGEPPVNVVVENGDWWVPTISVDHLSKAQATAFAVADNRTPTLGHDDLGRLSELLQEVHNEIGLAGTGYSEMDLAAMLGVVAESEPISAKASTAAPTPTLAFGKIKVLMTEDEARAFTERLDEWIDVSGTTFGFVARLLGLSS